MEITQLVDQIEELLEANGGSCPLDLLFLAFPDASQVMVRLAIAKLCNEGKTEASGSLLMLADAPEEESPTPEADEAEVPETLAETAGSEEPAEPEETEGNEDEELIGLDEDPEKTYELLSDEEADEFIAEVRRKYMYEGLEHLSDEPIIGAEPPAEVVEFEDPAPNKKPIGVFSWDSIELLSLSVRPSNVLDNAGVKRISELVAQFDSFAELPNCGAKNARDGGGAGVSGLRSGRRAEQLSGQSADEHFGIGPIRFQRPWRPLYGVRNHVFG